MITPKIKEGLRWRQGRSLFWQSFAVLVVWAYVIALDWTNDGLWYRGDSSRHAMNGLFWWDFLTSLSAHPFDFALSYYARYPAIAPTAYPPFFYLLEGMAYRLFGISPFVAKGLVLGFALLGTFYMMAWIRRWIGQAAGWIGILFLLQPAIFTWSHAVMLNVPSTALGVAALYHWRRWLEDLPSRHVYLASAFGLLMVLTYIPSAIVALIMLAWILFKGRGAALLKRRVLMILGISIAVLLPWAVFQWNWAVTHRIVGFYAGPYPLWELKSWVYYFQTIPQLVTIPLLIAGAAGIAIGLWKKQWREEVSLALLWLGICYVWFSAISVKEPRYILLLIPPIVCLAAVGITGVTTYLTNWHSVCARRGGLLIAPVSVALLLLHLWTAEAITVPHVAGFHEIASFIRTVGPQERVFYDGDYGGVFVFYVRAGDEGLRQSVTLGSKLLYVTTLAGDGLTELVASSQEVLNHFKSQCGCKWLVVQREVSSGEVMAQRYLREALRTKEFRLVRSFPMQAGGVTDVDVYEYVGPMFSPSEVELRFPSLGEGLTFRSRPIER